MVSRLGFSLPVPAPESILHAKVYWGYLRIMEKNMETTIVYWACIGMMERKMETTIVLTIVPAPMYCMPIILVILILFFLSDGEGDVQLCTCTSMDI